MTTRPGFSRGHQQIRLPRKERGNLQNVGNFRGRSRVRDLMNIGQDRKRKTILDFLQNAQAFGESRPAVGLLGRAVRLVVRRLENEWHVRARGDFRKPLGHHQRVRFAFDHARPGNQNQRLIAADAKISNRDFSRGLHVH